MTDSVGCILRDVPGSVGGSGKDGEKIMADGRGIPANLLFGPLLRHGMDMNDLRALSAVFRSQCEARDMLDRNDFRGVAVASAVAGAIG